MNSLNRSLYAENLATTVPKVVFAAVKLNIWGLTRGREEERKRTNCMFDTIAEWLFPAVYSCLDVLSI